ncbi:MAG: class I SAM-dependent methyltransferase, partial [Candidatus Bathyarchaeia archaeon]
MGRILEPEAMNEDEEAVAYSDAVAQRYLDNIDNSFVDKAATLGVANGTLLDLGAGPAKIPVKLITRLPEMRAVVIDLSQAMLKQAKNNINTAGVRAKVDLLRADAKRLPLRNSTFEIVICNSLLHHLANPVRLLNEIERVSANG